MDELLKIIKDGGGGDGGSSSGASASHPPVAAAAEAAGKARNANPEAMASMRGHAERLWKYLDNLAEESPEAYDKFVKEQAAAAGVDFEGGRPRPPPPPSNPSAPALVVVTSVAATGEPAALFVWEAAAGGGGPPAPRFKRTGKPLRDAHDVDESNAQDVDLGVQLRGKPRHVRDPKGLPREARPYLVVDLDAHALAIACALPPLPAPPQAQLVLSRLVQRAASWTAMVLGCDLSDKRRVLALRTRVAAPAAHAAPAGPRMDAHEAAQGTAAAGLSDATLREIARLGLGGGPSGGTAGAAPAPRTASRAAPGRPALATRPLIEVMDQPSPNAGGKGQGKAEGEGGKGEKEGEKEGEGGEGEGACCLRHSLKLEAAGGVRVRAEVAPGVAPARLQVFLRGRSLVFATGTQGSEYVVDLAGEFQGCTPRAKFRNGKVTVTLGA